MKKIEEIKDKIGKGIYDAEQGVKEFAKDPIGQTREMVKEEWEEWKEDPTKKFAQTVPSAPLKTNPLTYSAGKVVEEGIGKVVDKGRELVAKGAEMLENKKPPMKEEPEVNPEEQEAEQYEQEAYSLLVDSGFSEDEANRLKHIEGLSHQTVPFVEKLIDQIMETTDLDEEEAIDLFSEATNLEELEKLVNIGGKLRYNEAEEEEGEVEEEVEE